MGSAAAPAGNSGSISLDKDSKVPFYEQFCEAVRVRIESGVYPIGYSLPSVEDFAERLTLSRSTVRRTLHKLSKEGLIAGTATSGYTVTSAVAKPIEEPVKSESPVIWPTYEPELVESEPPLPTAQFIKELQAEMARQISPAPKPPSPRPAVPIAPKAQPPIISPPAVSTPVHRMVVTVGSAATGAAAAPASAPIETPPASQENRPAPPETRIVPFNRINNLEQIDLARLHVAGAPRPFRPGLPATTEFPLDIWEGVRRRLLRESSSELLDYTGTFGYLPLRQAIASRLRNTRGVRCSAEQVIICAGAQQALNLVINTLVSPGDLVGLEEPGYYGVKAAFLQAGAKICPLLVDDDGLSVPDARRQVSPLIIYATPANQFPLGGQLTLPRRLQLLDFARKKNSWVVEDDSDGEFRYFGRSVPSLQGSDENNRVIYLGTTGKSLFPSLEVGYIVVPLSLMESFSKTKEIMGGHASVIDQATFARFLVEGHFDRHIGRMKQIYSSRLNVLAESVDAELGDFIDLEPVDAGFQSVGWLKRGVDEQAVTNAAASSGLELPLISSYGQTALIRPGVVFGFASFSERMIKQAVSKLSVSMKSPQTFKALTYTGTRVVQRKPGFLQRIFHR